MLKKLKTSLLTVMAFGLFALPAAVAIPTVSAQSIEGGLNCGSQFNLDPNANCKAQDTNTDFQNLLKNIVNIISVIVGVISVIMIIFGGFRYITSGGDSGKVGNAKNTILYALIGLVIVALAQFIVYFVLNQTGQAVGTP